MSTKAQDADVRTRHSRRAAQVNTELAALPESVRAVVEECRAEVAASTVAAAPAVGAGQQEGDELPYTCRLYESVPGEEELLQLQWMRVDMSTMDSEKCWAEESGCDEYHNCGRDCGVMMPAVYRVDPAEIFPLTFVGLPPDLFRDHRDGGGGPEVNVSEELPEDSLCSIGRGLTEALGRIPGGQGDVETPAIFDEVASLAQADWSSCLERHVNLTRCDPMALARLLGTRPPPSLDCLLGAVLPSLIESITSYMPDSRIEDPAQLRESNRKIDQDVAAVRAICRLGGALAASVLLDPVHFRNRLSESGLRKFGPLGTEAELVMAESFFHELETRSA